MSRRQIVSYDDLYEETEEAEQSHTSAPAPNKAGEVDEEKDISHIISCQGTWDDTELIRAWDSTIADYRKHHAEILGDKEMAEELRQTESKVGEWQDATVEDVGGEQENEGRASKRARTEEAKNRQGEVEEEALGDYSMWQMSNPEPPASEEDALYRLNMSWYYAGYYAGYYQAYRNSKDQGNSSSANDGANKSG